MIKKNEIILAQYSIFRSKKNKRYSYDLDSHEISESLDFESTPSGWVVDMERILKGPNEIAFFTFDGEKYIASGNGLYKQSDGYLANHKKGIFISKLSIKKTEKDSTNLLYIEYITPWWRLIFDDGQFPDTCFPIEYLLSLHGWMK